MSDLKTTAALPDAGENLDEHGRPYNEKLQAMGKALLSALYMLVRSVKMYDPENAVFLKPLTALQETINTIVAKDGKLVLQGVKDTFYLNGMLIRLEASSLENIRSLIAEMQAKDVGGLSLTKRVSQEELRNFIFVFSRNQNLPVEEDGVAGRKLAQIKVTRWSSIQEKLSDDPTVDTRVDRQKYAMTVFARGIVFTRKVIEQIAQGKHPSLAPAGRIIQDLVDVAFEHRTHLLGLTSRGDETQYLIFHHVNTAVMCLVFGNELGLSKQQLRELGLIALFHELAMATLAPALLNKPSAYTAVERELIANTTYQTIKLIVLERNMSKVILQRIAAVYEQRMDWGRKSKDPATGVERLVQGKPLKLYSRILSICSTYDSLTSKRAQRDAYGPEIAINLMWGQLSHKFDPELLAAFARVMAIQPIKVLKKSQSSISISGV